MTYLEKLQDPRWQKKRLEVMQRDNFTCVCCGDKETTLNVHHLKYTGKPWEAPNESLITTCKHCHTAIEFKNIYWESYFKVIKIKSKSDKKNAFLIIIVESVIYFLQTDGISVDEMPLINIQMAIKLSEVLNDYLSEKDIYTNKKCIKDVTK